jgi:glycosyltransferase involved in cell wall biosynthesis
MNLSVIIPAYQAERTLPIQLRALAAQAGEVTEPWEVIVADNGSTDGTAAVAETFAGRLPVRVVDASRRRGPAAARNDGAAASRGRVLVFTDADDVVQPGWLAAWSAASRREDDRWFGTGPVARIKSAEDGAGAARVAPGRPPTHLGRPYAYGTNLVVPLVVFDEVGGFDLDRRTGEDADLSWRLLDHGCELLFERRASVASDVRAPALRTLRRYFLYGRGDPALYRDHRGSGLEPPSSWAVVRSYLGLLLRLPLLVFPGQRERWLHQAGRRAGRLVGSVEAGVWYP